MMEKEAGGTHGDSVIVSPCQGVTYEQSLNCWLESCFPLREPYLDLITGRNRESYARCSFCEVRAEQGGEDDQEGNGNCGRIPLRITLFNHMSEVSATLSMVGIRNAHPTSKTFP